MCQPWISLGCRAPGTKQSGVRNPTLEYDNMPEKAPVLWPLVYRNIAYPLLPRPCICRRQPHILAVVQHRGEICLLHCRSIQGGRLVIFHPRAIYSFPKTFRVAPYHARENRQLPQARHLVASQRIVPHVPYLPTAVKYAVGQAKDDTQSGEQSKRSESRGRERVRGARQGEAEGRRGGEWNHSLLTSVV